VGAANDKNNGDDITDPVAFTEIENRVMVPYISGIPADSSTPDHAYVNPRIPNEWSLYHRQVRRDLIVSFYDWQWRPEFFSVRAPVLCVHGTESNIPDVRATGEWVETLGNSRLFVIEGGATYAQVSHPHILFPAVETFLNGSWPLKTITIRMARK